MIAQSDEIKEKILDVKHGRVKEGLKIGVDDIDEFLRYKQGNLVLAIGHANVGKTTILCYLFTLWAVKHNLRFLIWSSENTPQSIVRKIIEFKMGEPIQTASEVKIDNAMKWCDQYFKVIDVTELYTYQDLLDEAKAIKNAWDYNALLVDPYNSLSKDRSLIKSLGNSHEYDYEVSSEFRLFAKKTNTTVFINAHGVTSALRSTHPIGHEFQQLPMPLSMSNVEGGGKWGNRADDVLCIHRYVSHPSEWMYSHISVLKVKENETGGRPTSYDNPIKIRMQKNNVGFDYMGRDLLHQEQIKQMKF
jgi:archaellum biogenesis ATPase FlaH